MATKRSSFDWLIDLIAKMHHFRFRSECLVRPETEKMCLKFARLAIAKSAKFQDITCILQRKETNQTQASTLHLVPLACQQAQLKQTSGS